jgi:large repetitive protein
MNRPSALAASVLFLALTTRLMAQNPCAENDPPVVTITVPTPNLITSLTTIPVSAAVLDESPTTVTSTPPGVAGSLGAGGGTVSGTVSLIEGKNLITVTATDSAGNVGGNSRVVIRDSTAPTIEITSPLEASTFGSSTAPTVTVVVSVTDATATLVNIRGTVVSVPAGGGVASASVDLIEGANTVSVTVTDEPGNSSSKSRVIFYDTSAPRVVIHTPLDGATFGPGQQNVMVTGVVVDESPSSMHVVSSPPGVDQVPVFGGVSGTITLAEGLNTITLIVTDAGGNRGSAVIQVFLDTLPPAVTLESPTHGSIVRGSIDLHAEAHAVLPSTVTKVDLFVDGGLAATLTDAPYEIAFDTTTLPDGLHTFTTVATDGKGSYASASATVSVDNMVPTVAITTPANGAFVSGNTSFTAEAADAGSGLEVLTMLANGAPPTVDGSFTFNPPVASGAQTSSVATQLLPDGPLLLTAKAKDAAGYERMVSITVIVDNMAPQKALITPIDGAEVSGAMPILAEANDPNLASLTLFLGGVPYMTSTSGILATTTQTAALLDGPLEVKIVALDLAGNSSTSVANVTVDNMAVRLNPQTLNLKSKGGDHSVTARVSGVNVALLLPTESNAIELRVPGGSPVPSTQCWPGDDAVTNEGGTPGLTIKFDRQALISVIRAGLAFGSIPAGKPVPVTLVANGRIIGTDSVKVSGQ